MFLVKSLTLKIWAATGLIMNRRATAQNRVPSLLSYFGSSLKVLVKNTFYSAGHLVHFTRDRLPVK